MMVRSGIDLIDIKRINSLIERFGARFLERVFTPGELSEVAQRPDSLAARFAAKEAVAKALGTGIGAVTWREIEIRRGPAGEPLLHLHGEAQRRAQALGICEWSISLSHTRSHAVAMAVGVGDGGISSMTRGGP
jgi:holo-[acyl-carrier protein] synthase